MAFSYLSLLVLFLCATSSIRRSDAALAPALFILGDSTVDTGNQDYITSVIKSNYPPYGMDFVPPGPTGRFSNGKLANDFLAEYLGLPSPVNFMDPKATGSTLLTGVNLASSGSGYLDITGQLVGVLNMTMQLENLGIIQVKINQQIGEPASQQLFAQAIFLISTGSNDFVNNYNINPVIKNEYNPPEFQQLLLTSFTKNLMDLYDYGARKVVIISLGPVGCTPEQLNLYGSKDGSCLEWVNTPLMNFNEGLKSLVTQLRSENPDYNILLVDCYSIIQGFINDPASLGFKYVNEACCGEGNYNGLPCASPLSNVCANPDDYIFWDLFHPSQKTYQAIATAAISGGAEYIYPSNLQSIL